MTNDGEFANLMMHPSSHLEKVYEVSIKGLISGLTVHQLEKGIYLDGVKTLPCRIKIVGKDEEHGTTMLMIKLIEGKNRQVKKLSLIHILYINEIKYGNKYSRNITKYNKGSIIALK